MENHDHNGHGESHDDHATEGNRQYYPKGWALPLFGLVVIALGFAVIGYFCFNVAGTDKWGKTEQCEAGHGEGHGEKGECCADGKECDHHKSGHGDAHSHDANDNDAHMQADTMHHDANMNHADSAKTLPAAEGHDHHEGDAHQH